MLITETEGPGNLQNVCCFIALDEFVDDPRKVLFLDMNFSLFIEEITEDFSNRVDSLLKPRFSTPGDIDNVMSIDYLLALPGERRAIYRMEVEKEIKIKIGYAQLYKKEIVFEEELENIFIQGKETAHKFLRDFFENSDNSARI
ncbi:hypothetical protein [Gimesia panareensis]|uniref:hypothetical protein n=1 Tax=Gimesia panareensis TaxID=2527978 RepID=UPI0011895BD7|nr:hypothetical protein [Gimesia panareensis]QDU52125.1 hypothetical protein Pan110_44970 [Gimesia panareensis]